MITNKQIGNNLSLMRTIRGMSQKMLADRLSQRIGQFVSVQTISAWQRGKRTIAAYILVEIADILQCTPHQIVYNDVGCDTDDSRLMDEVIRLPQRQKQTLLHLLCTWQGNTHILLQFCRMYASLPPHVRQDIAYYGIHQYKVHRNESSSDVDIDKLIQGWKNLTKGEHHAK